MLNARLRHFHSNDRPGGDSVPAVGFFGCLEELVTVLSAETGELLSKKL